MLKKLQRQLNAYEWLFLFFALTSICLISITPLSFSFGFARVFSREILRTIAIVYSCAVVVGAFRWCLSIRKNEGISSRTAFAPYLSLGFLIRTARRSCSLYGTVYFFLHLKHAIIYLNPSNYDFFLWNADRFLHFGVQPNLFFLQMLANQHEAAIIIDWLYIKYFAFKLVVSAVLILEIKGEMQANRFILASIGVWVFGAFGYLLFPADGPCYSIFYKEAVPENLQRHVFSFPVENIGIEDRNLYRLAKIWTAKNFQEYLWNARYGLLFKETQPNLFYGIAAMPSLHVAAMTVLLIGLSELTIIGALIAFPYWILVAIGAVFLQWHYMVDVYAGILLGVGMSIVSKRVYRQ
jgi:membrane-associated phospholipid phosphatase